MKQLLLCALALSSAALFGIETVNIDAQANRHPIDPRIYGVNNAAQSQVSDLNVTMNRQGGNNTSTYNWLLNADNRCKDYFFESIAYPSATAGEHTDTHISGTKAAGAEPMVTIPMLDWVAKITPARDTLGSFSVIKYGAQDASDGDFGDGVKPNGVTFVTGNDPSDANVPSNVAFQANWINHIVGTFNTAASGGVRYYMLDNEPGIWHLDHRDVHPVGSTMDEIRDKMIAYATQIKASDSTALVMGPDEWNYEGYFFSGYDEQYRAANGFNTHPDQDNHGGMAYLPYILDQLHQKEITGGKRLLDIFSVHYYPQDSGANGVIFSDDVTPAVQARRNRATRSLWDPNYVDESYLATQINLIPTLKGWVNQYYPNTAVAVNEYSFGAEGDINGATAQADCLGIFGRESLDVACRWEVPATGTPTYSAFKMYRNYDGQKSTFGDMSVKASVTQPDNLAAFAAVRSVGGALTVMVINKIASNTPIEIDLSNFSAGASAQAWQLTAANTITRLADVAVAGGKLTTTAPQQSITLFVIPSGSGAPGTPPAIQSNATAVPNPAIVGQAVAFSVAASDADGDALTFAWDFGDGTTGSGATPAHTYSTPGIFNGVVSVSDGISSVTSSATVFVDQVVDGIVIPNPGDPTGAPAAGGTPVSALTLSKLQIKLNFARSGSDSISLSGALPAPAGFNVSGQKIGVVIDGVVKVLTFDGKGHAKSGGDQYILAIKSKGGAVSAQTAKFSAKFAGSLAAQLADLLPNDNTNASVSLPVWIVFNGTEFQKSQTLHYAAKKGKTGSAK